MFNVNFAIKLGKLNIFSNFLLGSKILNSFMKAGNNINVSINEIKTPTLIIHPKLITGKRPDNMRELKPATVVITVKKHGLIICVIVSKTKDFCDIYS